MTDYSSSDLDSSDYLGDSPYHPKIGVNNNIKLAATVAMNTAYHPYSDITPPHHPPSPDNNNYQTIPGGYHNGHTPSGGGGGGGVHTPQLTPMDDVSPPDFHHLHHQQQHQHPLHHHPSHQHQLNNNNNNNSPIKLCGGCGEKISDRYLLHALDQYWHNSCLKCSYCQGTLADMGSRCYTRSGLVLCKKDYSSMFGCSGTCQGCGQTIPPDEMVAKAISPLNQPPTNLDNNPKNNNTNQQTNLFVFHLKCFSCTKCGSHLNPGDRYTMLSGSLVCEQDWHKIIKSTTTTNGTTPAVRKGKVGRPRRTKE